MRPEFGFLTALAVVFLCLDVLTALAVFLVKSRAKSRYRRASEGLRTLNRLVLDADGPALGRAIAASPFPSFKHLNHLLGSALPGPAGREALDQALASLDIPALAARRLRSPYLHRRIEAYRALGLSRGPEAQALLMGALTKEKKVLGRLVLLDRIACHAIPPAPALLALGLEAGKPERRARELAVLAPLAPALRAGFETGPAPGGEALTRLYLMTARALPTEADWKRLSALAVAGAGEGDEAIAAEAADILAERFPPARFIEAFASRPEARFRLPIARLLGLTLEPGQIGRLDPFFAEPPLREAGIAAAVEVLRRHPGAEEGFLDAIGGSGEARGAALSRALEHRLPALLYHAAPPLDPRLKAMIRRLLDESRAGALVEALSSSLPAAVRAALLAFLREELPSRPEAEAFLSRHLEAGARSELGLAEPAPEPDRTHLPLEPKDRRFLVGLILLALAIFPAAFALRRAGELAWMSAPEILYSLVFDFQFLFAFYSLAINSIYLGLLLLSAVKLRVSARLWELDLPSLLARPGVLPSVSILVPAYNEETTIVESVHSLLSLTYPSYEIIVVNDGSKDGTVGSLVAAFGLEPVGAGRAGLLPSLPVRSIYRSRALPNLILVDKANGGKADAINAGLGRAGGDYVCTIDADSILDPQSLLRALFQVVASDREILAIGGNVFPVNGCLVEHGHLQEISIPEVPLARFQVVEYLRSFVAGRLGWTLLDGLLIISGAFGIFRRDSVLTLGGYLTGQGVHRHETVGEDMEIVVRLVRQDREAGGRGKIDYAYNANCWTEVPEEGPVLRRQRDRWHRGLMEVLCFHRKMAGRRRYGAVGLLSMPYFFAFELVGPWLETLGYLVLALALILGLVDPAIPLIVLGISIGFGILISIASMLLAERQILYFRPREFFLLLLVAVAENLGYRQLVTIGRVISNIQFIFVRKGWEKAARKGFTRAPSARSASARSAAARSAAARSAAAESAAETGAASGYREEGRP